MTSLPPSPSDQAIDASAIARRVQLAPRFTGMLRKLVPYVWPHGRADLRRRIYVALALMLLAKLVTVAVPYAFKWATDAVTRETRTHAPATHDLLGLALGPIALVALYGALRVLMGFATQARDALFAAVAMNAVRRLAQEVFVHLHQLSLRFHLERKTGGLTRVLERGRNAIETIVRIIMLTAIPTVVEFTLILVVLFFQFDVAYVGIVLGMILLYLAWTFAATNWRMSIRRSMNESDTDANTKAIDSLLNYETVKYFGAEAREAQRYDRSMARYEATSIKTYTSLTLLNAGQAVIFTAGLAGVMMMSVAGIRAGTHTVGDFVLVNAMMIQLYQPLNFMGMVYREVKQATIDIEMMFDILGQNAEITDPPGAPAIRVPHGHVRFEDVSFSYDRQRRILNRISFEIPPGRTVAVVGPSGAGKSTLSRLLFRFYEPSAGRITIDGQDIATVTQASLRSKIGMVPQDTVLFNDTIAYNIRYGRWDASEAEVRQAAKLAQIDHFIAIAPGGYDAQVGERGLKLSGGEKQRVAIARTILKAPPILILDEATSALDTFTEREIQASLAQVSRGRTTLVIAHRLSTIVDADEILVLDAGRIVERGTHDALLAQNGAYAAMWNRQHQVAAAEETRRRALAQDGVEHEDISASSETRHHAPLDDQREGAVAEVAAAERDRMAARDTVAASE